MPHKFHRSNCQSVVRLSIKDGLGRQVTLMGKHAFEWSVVIESDNKITITTFPNRERAKKEFDKYSK